jgi:cobalt/nickel transport system permease protein
VSALPFSTFLLVMQPIHLAIGLVEGLATTAVVAFVWKARPAILNAATAPPPVGSPFPRKLFIGLLAATVVTGGILSWFASTNPDGLEWSIFKAAGTEELEAPQQGVHAAMEKFQQKTALLPDYGLKSEAAGSSAQESGSATVVDAAKSVSGLVGGLLTLVLAGLIGLVLKHRKKRIRT